MHVIAAKAVCFGEAQTEDFRTYAHGVVENARVLAESLSSAGLRIISGGTENHLVLVDLSPLNITGREAEERLERVDIVVNKNALSLQGRPAACVWAPRPSPAGASGQPRCSGSPIS